MFGRDASPLGPRRGTRLRLPGVLALLACAALVPPASSGAGGRVSRPRAAAAGELVAAPPGPPAHDAPCLDLPSTWWVPPGLISPEAQALLRRIAAAGRSGDDEALGALARLGAAQGLDPWLVVDELLGLGLPRSADRYAQHAPLQRRELTAHVARTAFIREDADARQELLRAARRHVGDLDPMAGTAPPSASSAANGSLLELRLRAAHAAAACREGRLEEGRAAVAQAALDAYAMGWWSAARCAWSEAADFARRAGRCEEEAEHLGRLVGLAAERGTPTEQLEALLQLAVVGHSWATGRRPAICSRPRDWRGEPRSVLTGVAQPLDGDPGAARALVPRSSRAGSPSGRSRRSDSPWRRGEHQLRVAILERALGRGDWRAWPWAARRWTSRRPATRAWG
jgi:hypothetical protein